MPEQIPRAGSVAAMLATGLTAVFALVHGFVTIRLAAATFSMFDKAGRYQDAPAVPDFNTAALAAWVLGLVAIGALLLTLWAGVTSRMLYLRRRSGMVLAIWLEISVGLIALATLFWNSIIGLIYVSFVLLLPVLLIFEYVVDPPDPLPKKD